jgi:hypothetical protein
MKALQVLKMTIFFTAVLLTSCKKKDDDLSNTTENINLLNTNEWGVVAKHAQPITQGNFGGHFGTQAFSLQSPNELRWYLLFAAQSYYSDFTEIVLNKQNIVTVSKPSTGSSTDFREIKTVYGGNTWETHIPSSSGYSISVFKNNQIINTKLDSNATEITELQASEDGLLNNSVRVGTNTVSHFHYGTEKWKSNTFFATSHVSARYNNRTYVVNLNKNTSQDGIGLYSETDDKVIGSQGQIRYSMKAENHLSMSPVGFIMHAAQYGDNVFVALDAYGNKFEVYKINLTNFTIQKLVDETKAAAYGQAAYRVRYLASLVEIDPNGNLYVVENRVENQKSHYSVRKYNTNGGNEVILKESDLKEHTRIEGLKYFNNKLHVALNYRQENPQDFTDNTYHCQIINKN